MKITRFFFVIVLLIIITFGTTSQTKDVTDKFTGYLFAYFEGRGDVNQREQIRFAISRDAVHWKALNDNNPVLESKNISQTGGVRDPHILRGEDRALKIFILAMVLLSALLMQRSVG